MSQPWTEYRTASREWDTKAFPYIVRWYIPYPDRLTRWTTRICEFATLEEAVAAYKRPFKGISIELMAFNGGPSGQHMDTLASRKCTRPSKWNHKVPKELRGAA